MSHPFARPKQSKPAPSLCVYLFSLFLGRWSLFFWGSLRPLVCGLSLCGARRGWRGLPTPLWRESDQPALDSPLEREKEKKMEKKGNRNETKEKQSGPAGTGMRPRR